MKSTFKSTKKATAGILAGAAGIALLAGGTTFALWSDETAKPAAAISNGDMSINVNDGTWADVSTGVAKPLNPATFRSVPGDKLRFTVPITLVASGDNAGATLGVKSGSTVAQLASKNATATYSLTEVGQTQPMTGAANVAIDQPIKVAVPKNAGKSYTLQIDVSISATATGRYLTGEVIDLGAVTYSLLQNR
ncbi:alternate-type signal peptide domain-containing protein [Frigoribacterium sp. SL97]|uniref:alternate-type signal peptide domain-containing protein n=1 Tax=Frigoribacterium sp. SL97 TaxID=2994664 RepID=UPI00226F4B54|nr:alternate-type signal peptide domain-containing protein [Frigoribacterium sp. SL97]WAC50370.1 alternate-type signal peptide domain-containing protein [Frigoribacterium sp. SL97]